jgi:tetratricopeptide (TPR) repeat protein
LLDDEDRKTEILQRQRDWVRANSWAAQAARISNIIHGCFEETHGAELRAPEQAESGSAPPPKAEARTQQDSSLLRDEDLAATQKLLQRKAVGWGHIASAAPGSVEVINPPPSPQAPAGRHPQPVGGWLGLLRGFGSRSPRADPKQPEKTLISRADWARDSRDWVSAARYYREALDQKPDNPPIWVQYGHALKESGNLPEAENAYRKSLELDAKFADTHLQLGHALKIQGRKIEAGVAYLRALALDPALDHAAFELKGLGWTRGRIQLALRRERSEKEPA